MGTEMNTTREEALAALPADAAEPSDRELREWLWKSHGHGALYGDDEEMQCPECNPWDYKRAPLLAVVRAAFAAVRASTPTLTRKEVGKGLGWTSDKTGVYIPWDDFPKVADRLNTILAAKSQR